MRALSPIYIPVLLFIAMLLPIEANSGGGSPQDILVISNKSVPASSVTQAQLKNYYLKKQGQWSGGMKVIPINARSGTRLRNEFLRRVVGMSATEETRYFQDLKIQKGTNVPAEFGNVQKAVSKLKGSVGYVFRSEYKEGVTKVLLTVPAG